MDSVRKSHRLAGISLTAILLLGAGTMRMQAQQPRTLAPTALEAFAALPDTKTVWSTFIGWLEAPNAYAIISAVVMESSTSTPKIMRGIRIELRHEGPRPSCDLKYAEWVVMCEREQATVYVEESRLDVLRSSRSTEVHPGHPAGVTHYWSGIGSGLLLFGYDLRDRSDEFATMVAAAQAALATAPR